MTRQAWIVVAVLVAALLVGGGAYVAITREQMAELLRAAFARYGLPEAWGEAFGRTESRLNPRAVSPVGAADDKLGRAYGATQITRRLLELVGGPSAEVLGASPDLQAEWTARLVAEGAAVKFRADGSSYLVRYGRPASLEDAGAVWNAGRRTFAELGPQHVTRVTYVPRLLAAYEEATA